MIKERCVDCGHDVASDERGRFVEHDRKVGRGEEREDGAARMRCEGSGHLTPTMYEAVTQLDE